MKEDNEKIIKEYQDKVKEYNNVVKDIKYITSYDEAIDIMLKSFNMIFIQNNTIIKLLSKK